MGSALLPVDGYHSTVDSELLSSIEVCRWLGFDQPRLDRDTISLVRRRWAQLQERVKPVVSGDVAIDEITVDAGPRTGVTVRVLRGPASGRSPAILSIHGGGLCFGSASDDDRTAAEWVRRIGCVVVCVDYRLAPEHSYSDAVTDCATALNWLAASATELGVDRDRIAIAGFSAGGGLAAATALLAARQGGPHLRFQALLAPMLDDRPAPSVEDHCGIPSWSHQWNQDAWALALPDAGEPDRASALAPVQGRADDLSGLPPTLIQVGQLEVFRHDCMAFAEALHRAAVPVKTHVYAGAYHGWDQLAPAASISRRSRSERTDALLRAMTTDDGCAL